ncbi:hypothetical protein NQ315_003797 [Exocentrus adspersus]|uniref:Trehalase n=1 Tax=Exocentrus adspersus TaxID=1586481 RepID=A0AAV8VDJ8_9CUCU|nr:hypothetical protein NQ315_003797 [Exocentrus adspersus]
MTRLLGGDILHVVQTAKIFNDSKTFVDLALVNPVNETLSNFYAMMTETEDNPSKERVEEFVHKNFKSIGELDDAEPRDFQPEPKILHEITDPVVRSFTKNLIAIWPSLTRKVSYHVFENPDTHSLIPVQYPFIIPGGRFKEYYYWDSYWIIKGLLLSDMVETARGMVQNILSMVERYGFVPNGGRIYYLNRSQPPLLTFMVDDYIKYAKDYEFLRQNIQTLEKELNFWLTKRTVEIDKDGNIYTLAHFDSSSDTPRPESYFEDIETCASLLNDDEKLCDAQHKQSCTHPIYCQGDILHVVQTAKIFNDSKTFVDMALVNPINETINSFYTMMAETDNNPSKGRVTEFVNKNFRSIGELEEVQPRDFRPEPNIIKEINDPVVRAFTKNLIAIWPTLARKVSYHVIEDPDTHSLIPVQHPFIIPGGRFKEYYYWDSYWIIKGLLLSDMVETARGMVQNIISMVERFGFVPNGGRVYYLNRSQPPLLTLMVYDYVRYTKDYEFLRQNIHTLEKELHFWLTLRTVEIRKGDNTYTLAHFDSSSDTPRPESYFEDIETCANLESDDEKYECYTDLKSGAESGWDFTARWFFHKEGGVSDQIKDIRTRRNIPTDLNAFIYKALKTMNNFYMILRKPSEAKRYLDLAERWREAIEEVLYNNEDGTWYDYDIKTGKQRRFFFASNLTPLWAGAMPDEVKAERGKRSVEYLRKMGILNLRGGIPSSLLSTGQQWDYPNAWSPYQNLIIIGLHKTGDPEAVEVAKELALKWVNSNIKGYHENKAMFEKYNAQNSGQFGGGGEYHIQAGFGWTNGCILELINFYYRDKMRKSKGRTIL